MFEELIARTAAALNAASIPYMIIGGQAVLLYGEPRLTRDIDITLGVGIDKFAPVSDIIRTIGLNPLPEDPRTFAEQTMVLPVMDEKTGIRIDFVFSFTPYEQQAIQRINKISVHKTEVSFASPEDVIIHKIFAGRPRDVEDVRTILLKNPGLDINYMRQWLTLFDESFPEKGFLKILEDIQKSL